jgi:hypothetical protein
MSEHTPTTAEVSRRYMLGAWEESGDTSGDDVAQFDRWLAGEFARVWDEFAVAARACDVISRSQKETLWEMNPYRGVDDE